MNFTHTYNYFPMKHNQLLDYHIHLQQGIHLNELKQQQSNNKTTTNRADQPAETTHTVAYACTTYINHLVHTIPSQQPQ